MNKQTIVSLASVAAIGLLGCGQPDTRDFPGENVDPPEEETTTRSLPGTSVPAETYYTARQDFRKCIFPICGGWFLSEVNRPTTECADGTVVDSDDGCYVSEIDVNGLELSDGALLHGSFVKKEYGNFGTYDTLDLDAIYAPLFDVPHRNWFRYNLLSPNGIVCFTQPCNSTDIAKLNTPWVWQDPITFDDLEYFGGDLDAALEAFGTDYANGGAIVDSFWYPPWWTGNGWELSVTNIFVRNAPLCVTARSAFNDSIVAWNATTQAQAEALIGDDENWVWTDIAAGTCEDLAAATSCIQQWEPVCATIDATGEEGTYSNECVLTQAVRTAAGASSKATGTFTDGECVEPIEGGPGSICGGFANAQCVAGLECVGLGNNGSSAGVCGCPEFINCFPGPNAPGCHPDIAELCPDSEIAY